MPTQKLTHEVLAAALIGFDLQKRNIDGKITELRATLSGGDAKATATAERIPRKRRFPRLRGGGWQSHRRQGIGPCRNCTQSFAVRGQ